MNSKLILIIFSVSFLCHYVISATNSTSDSDAPKPEVVPEKNDSTVAPPGPNTTISTITPPTTTPNPNATTVKPPTPPTPPTPAPPTPAPNTTTTTDKPTPAPSPNSTTPNPQPTPAPTTTTTLKPNVTTIAPPTEKPTASPAPATTAAPSKDRSFDGPSFIGGIVLTLGLSAIGFIAVKFYKARTERNYHTL